MSELLLTFGWYGSQAQFLPSVLEKATHRVGYLNKLDLRELPHPCDLRFIPELVPMFYRKTEKSEGTELSSSVLELEIQVRKGPPGLAPEES